MDRSIEGFLFMVALPKIDQPLSLKQKSWRSEDLLIEEHQTELIGQ
jgi:hypothetical protein